VYGTLSFLIKCRIALIVLGCLLCVGASIGVAAWAAQPVEVDMAPPDPIRAAPLGENLRYRLDSGGNILLICEVYNDLDAPITLSDVYIGGDPTITAIVPDPAEIPAGGSGLVRISAAMDESCRQKSVAHDTDVGMVFHWEKGSALISLPLRFHTEPTGS
jgi:hypothetical protein